MKKGPEQGRSMAHPHPEPRIRVAVIGLQPEDKHLIL